MFGITFHSRTRTAKSNEQLENGCLLVKFWKPFVNLFPPSDGQGNFGAFSTCSRRENHFPYRTRKIPNSANSSGQIDLSCKEGFLDSGFNIAQNTDRKKSRWNFASANKWFTHAKTIIQTSLTPYFRDYFSLKSNKYRKMRS